MDHRQKHRKTSPCQHGDVLSLQLGTKCTSLIDRCPTQDAVPLLPQALHEQGDGGVLVVDGEGSMRCALPGDNIAEMAINGWSEALAHLKSIAA